MAPTASTGSSFIELNAFAQVQRWRSPRTGWATPPSSRKDPLTQRGHHRFPKWLASFHEIVPALHVGQFRMIDIQPIPAVDGCRCRDVAHRKGVAGEESSIRESRIENSDGSRS